ncbi:MAG: bifunctional serine/threonine-protein kinase/formylglycine-generating enzyme family protein [Planctomycetota bacterium]|jgi:formylglycine-generating enzyme required for sulfatase activity
MSPDWIEPALALFRQACELDKDERAAFLDRETGDDAELRQHVEAMLARDDEELVEIDAPLLPQGVGAALSDLAQQSASTHAEAEPTPATIGGHRILRLIAHGGMGVVYEAQQEHPQRRVAIKVARTGSTTSERARRFELEAQLLARLSHPGIAQIIEAGTTSPEAGAQPYFVMELVEGQPLTAYAVEHLPSTRKKLELMLRVCAAVAFAHEQAVVHRDLKPDNVLIDAGGQPKVLDFGVAKVEAAGGFGAATLRTEAGRVIGTLGYMAPEQLGGKSEEIGPEADVYSLGVMIYELLSGRLPHEFDGVTLTGALAVVATTDAPLLGVVRPEYRGDIEAVVAKALEKDARYRYADAAALQADLERFLRGEPILARPAGPLRRVAKWAGRNPALATAVLGLFLALSTVAGVLAIKNEEVQTALNEYDLIAASKRLERSIALADELVPARLDKVSGIEEWLHDYGELAEKEQLEEYEAALKGIRARATTRDGESWAFEDVGMQLKHDVLSKLIPDLEEFAGETGLAKKMERRRELARTIAQRTVLDRQKDWDDAIARIRENEKYPSLKLPYLPLTPQIGLIPLGEDPDSGLEEFLHFETHTGEIPRRDSDGYLPPVKDEFAGATGLIMVLIPGGISGEQFWMGAQAGDQAGDNYDPSAIEGWEKLSEKAIPEPFFLSKYEMTQGQWERTTGSVTSRPSQRRNKPVNRVSWEECDQAMHQLGLVLPDEVQWEYAARAETKTAFWSGQDASSLAGKENLFDLVAHTIGNPTWAAKWNVQPAPWFDEQKKQRLQNRKLGKDPKGGLAPIGSYQPNGFGLYDIAGNLAEWCSQGPEGERPEPSRPGSSPSAMVRGGSFQTGAIRARSASRRNASSGTTFMTEIGLRPAMAIQH